MKQLTTRQLEVADFIENYIRDNGFAPSIQNIADNFGFSKRAAYDHITALEKKGVIKTSDNLSRGISLIKGNSYDTDLTVIKVPFINSDNDCIPVAKAMLNITDSDIVFAQIVQSDSMKDIGILKGDIAIMLQTDKAANGDIVSAKIGDEDSSELKYYYQMRNIYELRAANSSYSNKISSYCKIYGRLLAIIKRY